MPIYEYQCSECSHCFEMIHGAAEQPKAACPKCGSLKTQRVVSTFSCGGGKAGESAGPASCGPTPRRFS